MKVLSLNHWTAREFPEFYFIFLKFIYSFLAALGPCYCVRASFSCSERGPLLAAVRGLLIVVASPIAQHGLQARGLQ